MDLGHLQNIVAKIELKKEIVKGIAEYCVINNKGNEYQIAKIFERQFKLPTSNVEQQLAILDVMSEILILTGLSEKKDITFFKPFAQKIKNFIEEISRKINEIKGEYLNIIPLILRSWSIPGRELFVPNFMEKLKKSAEPIIVAASKFQEEKKNGIFKNYSKTFLTEYEEVKSNQITGAIYDDYAKYELVMKQTAMINQQIRKVSLEDVTPEIKERAKELEVKARKNMQKLIEIVCNFQKDFKALRESCRKEFQKLPEEVKSGQPND